MRRRQGFTLVELLVSMALIIFIMTILSEAFSKGLEVFRNLKALGDLQERMRTAANLLRRDLAADHFEGKKRLSDPDFFKDGPPDQGFVRILQNGAATLEATDTKGAMNSYRATNDALHLAVKYRGTQRGDFLFANVPAGSPLLNQFTTQVGVDSRYQDPANTVYSFPWAETAWFLGPALNTAGQQDTTDGTAAGIPRWMLYRRQQLAVPDNGLINPALATTAAAARTQRGNYLEVSCFPRGAALLCSSPADLTMPARRLANRVGAVPGLGGQLTARYPPLATDIATYGAANTLQGADIVLADVVSFEVRVLLAGDTTFRRLDDATIQAFSGKNPLFPSAGYPLVFDTWSKAKDNVFDYSGWIPSAAAATQSTIPLYADTNGNKIRIVAIQVVIRAWDARTKQTRQVTIVQDM